MAPFLSLGLFILGYVFITLEHKLNTHKSAISLALGATLWIITAFHLHDKTHLQHSIAEAGTEIFSIIVFLLSAMTLVEILVHYQFFDLIRIRLSKMRLKDKKQFAVIATITFFLSALLDNLTVTIVMIQIARRFFRENNLLIVAAGIVILANAGGAWSPIGDVTTLMIWLAGKYSAGEIIIQTFIPSALLGIVSAGLLMKKMSSNTIDHAKDIPVKLDFGAKLVIVTSLSSFILPILMNVIGLPPYIGLLLGLGVVWLMIEFLKIKSKQTTHLEANIDNLLQKTDISSIKFFIGILLSASALNTIGILEKISIVAFGQNQDITRVIAGNILLGPLSSIVDNVPLTALAIDIIKVSEPAVWTLLALTVGTGGSFLVIGSVAGVIAMGMIKELTFGRYLRIATIPAVAGFIVGVSFWLLEYQLFLSR